MATLLIGSAEGVFDQGPISAHDVQQHETHSVFENSQTICSNGDDVLPVHPPHNGWNIADRPEPSPIEPSIGSNLFFQQSMCQAKPLYLAVPLVRTGNDVTLT
jgi:hypothetical protein